MPWSQTVNDTIKRLNNVKRNLKSLFTGRDEAIDLLVLATVCQEHLLLIGVPGTAKTAIINRYTDLIDAKEFSYLLTRFTEPSELFGPLDVAAFQKGTYHIRTEGMLPEAQIVFLDEVFQGSSAILNSLLTILNERKFYNGSQRQAVPLICLIGASNSLPDDPALHAFGDRFVLRLEVNRVEDNQIDELLEQGWELEREKIEAAKRAMANQPVSEVLPIIKLNDILQLHGRLTEVNLANIRPEYGRLVRELRAEGVEFSDRRVVKGLKLIAGSTLLRGAESAEYVDFLPLFHLWDRSEEADVLKTVLRSRLEEAGLETRETSRPVSDIIMDLETIEAQTPLLSSESAVGAHLMTLNKLRQELISNHPQDIDARKRVERVIQQGLQLLEVRG
ncbi:AAA family ATPase [Aetokthonos hydrillicola Thurmond2011]|uniref:AAA family ATPase n=1 Tax=Aetokthonos hydrillicola Thurmond2011 TaxID=2712845 RepID=A0AAP5M8P1_9CYAN|nr:AAA family ATPase [Aetokthonos hydrillicola]MBO3459573.1 AAA domain-containing protein [Aetokthonos hydrillicola CCALA 1050]MBW4590323.1 AAA family ATPase [Aetokthonos hydrillicola CCALA 1050]MDR9899391.1 AAA family ATPase [Aetokthonos hydrillicola Thurmond2011]